jgi:hypothetical protein
MRAILLLLVLPACGSDLINEQAPALEDTAGAPAPMVLTAVPDDESAASPDVVVRLVFSAPMDPAAATAFQLEGEGLTIPGTAMWDSTLSVLAFRPEASLTPGIYVIHVANTATSQTGIPLSEPYATAFEVIPGQSAKP